MLLHDTIGGTMTSTSATAAPGSAGRATGWSHPLFALLAAHARDGEHPAYVPVQIGRIDYLPAPATFDVAALGAKGDLGDRAFVSVVTDPYLSNPIARASATMAELSALRIAPVALAAE